MRVRALIWGAMAYLLVTFPLAFVWHLVAFKNTYDRLGIFNREEPIVPLGFLVILIQGFVLSYAFSVFRRGGVPLREGLKFGLLAGLFLWSSQVVAAAAKHQVTSISTWLLIESVYFVVQFTLVGLALGWVYARSTSPASASNS